MKAIAGGILAAFLAVVGLYEYLGPLRFALSAAAVLLVVAGARFAWWAFVPRSELPRHRVRHLRFRLYLRLHPGRGHASALELHRYWGRRACLKNAKLGRLS